MSEPDSVNKAIGEFATVVLAGALILPVVISVTVVIDAFVLVRLWAWFIPTLFPAIPLLTMPTAAGLAMVVRQLRPSTSWPKYRSEDKTIVLESHFGAAHWLTIILVSPAITLAVGWFIHQMYF